MIDKKFFKDYPILCHYTSNENVFNILTNRVIWAKNYQRLNDISEIIYAEYILQKHLKKHFGKNASEVILKNLYDSLGSDIHILSFCTMKGIKGYNKNDGLLSMWRHYGGNGDGGGCCIEFDCRKIFEAAKSLGVHFKLLKVIYYGIELDKTDFYTLLDDLINNINRIHLKKQITNNPHEDLLTPFFLMESNYIGHSELIKSDPPRIEIPFAPNSIKKIIVGPSYEQEDIVYGLEDAKMRLGYEFKIIESTIPTRI